MHYRLITPFRLFIGLICLSLCAGCGSPAQPQPSAEPATATSAPTKPADTAVPTATAVPATATPEPVPAGQIRLGYYTGDEASLQALKDFAPWLTVVSADIYGVDGTGNIVGSDDLGVVETAHNLGLKALLCISNYNSDENVSDFDPALGKAAIIDHRDTFIPAIVKLAVDGGFDGINIDFESLAMTGDLQSDRNAVTEFMQQLSEQTRAAHLSLAMSVPAKSADDPTDDWSYPYDLAALGKVLDYLQYMTYDQHGPWSEPGPVSGYDWVKETVAFAASQTDPSKILIGLPAYGYDWTVQSDTSDESCESFEWTDISARTSATDAVNSWDATTLSPSVTYTGDDGRKHTAWFENSESVRAKMTLVAKYELGGMSVWSLGKEDRSFWEAVAGYPNASAGLTRQEIPDTGISLWVPDGWFIGNGQASDTETRIISATREDISTKETLGTGLVLQIFPAQPTVTATADLAAETYQNLKSDPTIQSILSDFSFDLPDRGEYRLKVRVEYPFQDPLKRDKTILYRIIIRGKQVYLASFESSTATWEADYNQFGQLLEEITLPN